MSMEIGSFICVIWFKIKSYNFSIWKFSVLSYIPTFFKYNIINIIQLYTCALKPDHFAETRTFGINSPHERVCWCESSCNVNSRFVQEIRTHGTHISRFVVTFTSTDHWIEHRDTRLTTDEEQKHQHPRPLSLVCSHSLQMGPWRPKRSFSI